MSNYLINSFGASRWVHNRFRGKVLRMLGLNIGADANIFSDVLIHPGSLQIGDRVLINRGCTIDPGMGGIIIEDDVALADGVRVLAASHEIGGPERRGTGTTGKLIVIGRGSWVGAGTILLPGVHIGTGCIIGAGSVVTKDTEPDSVYVGSPARFVRRLDEIAAV